jgi:hypothetical protein
MKKVLLGIVIVALSLANCDKSLTPPASSGTSGDALQRKLQELAGNGANDCGRLKSQDQTQLEAASTCAIGAAKKKQAFYVAYELPGLIVALAGNSDGKLFSVQQEQPEKATSGNTAELTAAPCPSELRIAQSGRVTCTPLGSMGGGSMGGANPHGGMSMPPGGAASPHGGMSMPPGGTPNPHGGAGTDLPTGHAKSTP